MIEPLKSLFTIMMYRLPSVCVKSPTNIGPGIAFTRLLSSGPVQPAGTLPKGSWRLLAAYFGPIFSRAGQDAESRRRIGARARFWTQLREGQREAQRDARHTARGDDDSHHAPVAVPESRRRATRGAAQEPHGRRAPHRGRRLSRRLDRSAPGGPCRSQPRGVRQAIAYVASTDRAWPYSFENLCEALGLSADALRQELNVRREQVGDLDRRPRDVRAHLPIVIDLHARDDH